MIVKANQVICNNTKEGYIILGYNHLEPRQPRYFEKQTIAAQLTDKFPIGKEVTLCKFHHAFISWKLVAKRYQEEGKDVLRIGLVNQSLLQHPTNGPLHTIITFYFKISNKENSLTDSEFQRSVNMTWIDEKSAHCYCDKLISFGQLLKNNFLPAEVIVEIKIDMDRVTFSRHYILIVLL